MKKRVLPVCILLTILFLFLLGCEGVSVSVNADGDIAFARSEGIFFYNPDQKLLSAVEWKYGKKNVPVLVRWAPDGRRLAYTEKASLDSQETRIYIIGKNGENRREIYATDNPITELKWSPDGRYLSAAQAGEDTDLGVADIVILRTEQKKVVTVLKNTGDSHDWFDSDNMVYMKIDEANPDNSDIFKGSLRMHRLSFDEDMELAQTMVSKKGAVAVNPFRREIGFIAIKAGREVGTYEEYMSDDAYAFVVKPGGKPELAAPDVVNYIAFSPDGIRLLAKTVTWEGADLALIDRKTKQTRTVKSSVTDSLNIDSAEVQVYPAWYDNERVLFFNSNRVYGSNGRTLRLMMYDIAKGTPENLQIEIDQRIHEMVMEAGGY